MVRPKKRKPEPTYQCRGCKRHVPWSFGCDDDMPHHCDDCWADAHEEIVNAEH